MEGLNVSPDSKLITASKNFGFVPSSGCNLDYFLLERLSNLIAARNIEQLSFHGMVAPHQQLA